MGTNTIVLIILVLVFAIVDIALVSTTTQDERFDEIDISHDVIDYDTGEWEDLNNEIKRGDTYARENNAERGG